MALPTPVGRALKAAVLLAVLGGALLLGRTGPTVTFQGDPRPSPAQEIPLVHIHVHRG